MPHTFAEAPLLVEFAEFYDQYPTPGHVFEVVTTTQEEVSFHTDEHLDLTWTASWTGEHVQLRASARVQLWVAEVISTGWWNTDTSDPEEGFRTRLADAIDRLPVLAKEARSLREQGVGIEISSDKHGVDVELVLVENFARFSASTWEEFQEWINVLHSPVTAWAHYDMFFSKPENQRAIATLLVEAGFRVATCEHCGKYVAQTTRAGPRRCGSPPKRNTLRTAGTRTRLIAPPPELPFLTLANLSR